MDYGIKEKISNRQRLVQQCFFYTFVWGLVAHGYCFVNNIASHDALNNFYIAEKWSKGSFGRFFYPIYISITRGRILLPWLVGIIGVFWTALAVYLIVRIFDIQKKIIICLISAICITNRTVYALAATYLHDFDADLFALFLSVAAVYLWKISLDATKEHIKSWLFLGSGSITLSIMLGIYQSYISVTIVLIMMMVTQSLLKREDVVKVFFQGLRGILMLLISAIIYLCESKLFTFLTGINVLNNNSYNGLGNISTVLSGNFFAKIVGAYQDFAQAFLDLTAAYPGRIYLIVHGILAILIIAITIYGMTKLKWQSNVLIVLLGILMPLGMNISYILSGEMIHDIMRYAFWMIYLFALILIVWCVNESTLGIKIKQIVELSVVLCIAIVIAGNIQTSNTIYVKKDLEYQSTLSYMTRVADRMEENSEYIPGETPVYFVGQNAIGKTRAGFEKYTDITGVGASSPITFYDTYDKYFEYVLGLEITLSEDKSLESDERVVEMPVFPKQGSVQMVDGTMVVKMK